MGIALSWHQNTGGPLLGAPVAGLLWSITIIGLNLDELSTSGLPLAAAFTTVILGGLVQTMALWLGVSAVIWAMVRALKASIPLARAILLTSSASLPLWIGGPAAALWVSGNSIAGALTVLCLCALLFDLQGRINSAIGWARWRGIVAVLSTTTFLASFTYLAT